MEVPAGIRVVWEEDFAMAHLKLSVPWRSMILSHWKRKGG